MRVVYTASQKYLYMRVVYTKKTNKKHYENMTRGTRNQSDQDTLDKPEHET